MNLPDAPFARTEHKLGLYPVVDSLVWIERLLASGVRTIQLRIKDKTDAQVDEQIRTAVALGEKYQARLFINDYWRSAIKHGAYGVHLGQKIWILLTCGRFSRPDCASEFPPTMTTSCCVPKRCVRPISRWGIFSRHKPKSCPLPRRV